MTDHFRLTPTEVRLAVRERGYHPVPVSGPDMNVSSAGKRPVMKEWERRCFDAVPTAIENWGRSYPSCTNTGLLTGALSALDIDVLQPDLAGALRERATLVLGTTSLVRIGREPKVLLAYRLDIPIDKFSTPDLVFTDDPKEKATQIELLGRGQQFVGFGVHPDTRAPYRWPEASPLTLDFAEVPEVTEGLLRQFMGEAEELIRAAGGRTRAERRNDGKKREEKGRRAGGFKRDERPDHDTIADALSYITNDLGYDEWVRIGFALWDGLGEAGRDLWEHWSSTSAKNDPALTERKWSTFASGRSITIATLFWHASENGWKRQGRSGAPKQDRAERRASADPAAETPDEDGRPIVRFIAGKVPEAVDRMEQVLLSAGVEIYSRAGTLVRPVIDTVPAAKGRTTVVARMCSLSVISLADAAARIMRFERFDGRAQDWLPINPPTEMTATLLAREGQWKIPAVAGVVTTPTLRLDGSILDRPGYDPATRLYYAADPAFHMPPVSERPTKIDALRALALLEELLAGFPFVGPVDRAVALSGILTALVRGVIPTAPLHAIRAHTPGTGKSYLVDLASAIATGRRCPVIAAGKTEEETEKRLGALLRDAVPVVSIDNVNGELGGDALCQMTERPLIRVRILGKSEAPELECRAAVFATGNNLTLVGDMTRRAVLCTLDAGVEQPELRSFDFDPLGQVLADRGLYVAAALTVIRAYRVAGLPKVCGPIGSYEMWSDMVRAPLIWLHQADPVESMKTARSEDPVLTNIHELFEQWRSSGLRLEYGYSAQEIVDHACDRNEDIGYGVPNGFRWSEFRDLLIRVSQGRGTVNTRTLGGWFKGIAGRIADGMRLVVHFDKHAKANRYILTQDLHPADEALG